MRRNKRITRAQHTDFTIHGGFKRAGHHVGNLVMYLVRVGRADGALVKLHQHRHELRRVADDLAPQAIAQFGPRGGSAFKVAHGFTF